MLNGAPQTGEIQSAAFRPTAAPPLTQPASAQPVQAPHGPTDGGQQQAQEDDPAVQARKQAWQTYYQQLAALQQSRQQDATNALKADTAPNGMTVGGGAAAQLGAGAGVDPQLAQAQGTATQTGATVPAAYAGGHRFRSRAGWFGRWR